MYTCIHVYMYTCIHIYICIWIYETSSSSSSIPERTRSVHKEHVLYQENIFYTRENTIRVLPASVSHSPWWPLMYIMSLVPTCSGLACLPCVCVCVCVCVYVCMCVCVFVFECACVHTHAHIHTSCLHTRTHTLSLSHTHGPRLLCKMLERKARLFSVVIPGHNQASA